MDTSKIIEILDPQAGKIKETVLQDQPNTEKQSLFEAKNGRYANLLEASSTTDFPALLRDGIKAIVYDSYSGVTTTWQDWVMATSSDKQSEDWVETNALGELPIVGEGTPYPEIKRDLDRTVNIRNYKRGDILTVTEELIKFNRIAQIKFDASEAGRRAANTREQAAYSVVNTAGNYVRTTAAGDNDIGNNTAAVTFSALGLNTALATLRTMKDRKSGVYFGVNPGTLLVTPRLEMAAKQLLLSPELRQSDGSTVIKTYGQGQTNPFRGLINQIIVSPRLGSTYEWVLMEAKRAVILQEVEGLQILQESAGSVTSEAYFKYDMLRFRVRDWFGVGMLNDRYCFLSTSSTAPTVE